ncbi:MAG: hypothetical protein JSS66_11685 [Armatimonadetes bacterium]|nr:hypothetical protein [Armatimonadota bacterium]
MKKLLLAALLLGAVGCAKFPAGGSTFFTKRLVFKMKMDPSADLGTTPYIFVIPLRLTPEVSPTDQGPLPVTDFGGNGFVAGNCTHFILYRPGQANPYEIWQFSDTTLDGRFLTGYAINYKLPGVNGQPADTLECEIDMSQLVDASVVPTINTVQVNFFTFDQYAITQPHTWDALGDGLDRSKWNTFVNVDMRSSKTYTNTTQNFVEPPTGDSHAQDVNGLRANDPNLNMVDWSVEVRLP